MVLSIIVKASAKENCVEYVDGIYHIWTKSPATEGKANVSVISLLSAYLGIPKSRLKIKLGTKGRKKVVEVCE